jgi:hypothetical protein
MMMLTLHRPYCGDLDGRMAVMTASTTTTQKAPQSATNDDDDDDDDAESTAKCNE